LVRVFDIVPELYFFEMSFDAVLGNVIWYTSSIELLRTFVSGGSYILLPCDVFDIVPQVNCVVLLFDRMIYVEDKSNSFVMLYDAVPKKCYLRTISFIVVTISPFFILITGIITLVIRTMCVTRGSGTIPFGNFCVRFQFSMGLYFSFCPFTYLHVCRLML
jgi:hypothetical protein